MMLCAERMCHLPWCLGEASVTLLPFVYSPPPPPLHSQMPSPLESSGHIEETGTKRTAELKCPPAKCRKISDTGGTRTMLKCLNSFCPPPIATCPPGVSYQFLRKRSPVGNRQDCPPTETVVRCSPGLSEGAVAAERSLTVCEGVHSFSEAMIWCYLVLHCRHFSCVQLHLCKLFKSYVLQTTASRFHLLLTF